MPDITIRTTLIAGFPGETKEDFDELLGFIKSVQFDRLGAFAYSKEEGTPAAKMKDQLSEREKQTRQEKLMTVQQKISAKKNRSKTGKTYQVLVEGALPEKNEYYGRTQTDCPEADGLVFFHMETQPKIGEFVQVRILETSAYDLYGECETAASEMEY
jgi:ribosomal protein S12 methylthiotransferase